MRKAFITIALISLLLHFHFNLQAGVQNFTKLKDIARFIILDSHAKSNRTKWQISYWPYLSNLQGGNVKLAMKKASLTQNITSLYIPYGTQTYNAISLKPFENNDTLIAHTDYHCRLTTRFDPIWNRREASIGDYEIPHGFKKALNLSEIEDWKDQDLVTEVSSTTFSASISRENNSIASSLYPEAIRDVVRKRLTNKLIATVTDDSSQTANDETRNTANYRAAVDTLDYQIPLDPDAIFYHGDTAFFQLNNPNMAPFVRALIDEQNSDSPVTVFGNGRHNFYHTYAVIDLGGIYKITRVGYYKLFPSGTVSIVPGSPGHWSTSDTLKTTTYNKGWYNAIGKATYTRYLKVFYNRGGTEKIYEIKLYGHLVGDSMSRTPPHPVAYQRPSMHKFIGVNTFGLTPSPVNKIGGTLRKYTNQDYLDTAKAGIPVDRVQFVFTKFHGSSSNQFYYFPYGPSEGKLKTWNPISHGIDYYTSVGIDLYWSTQGTPQYAKNNKWGKSIDYTLHPGADGMSASQYDRLSRMAWTLGAVYGRNSYPTDSIQELVHNHQSGLNIMHFIEAGNENNGSWLNKSAFYNPEQAVAYMSAYYDGNNGRMGTRMGIKNADNQIQVLFWGDANSHLPYLKSMAFWAYYKRQDKSLPFDIYNVHNYFYSGKTAISPEKWNGGVRKYFKNIVDTTHIICRKCEVWLTEWGYDRNRKSPLGVPVIQGLDSAQIQAQWIARSWFELSFSGLDKAQLFQIQNDPLKKDYDSTGYYKFNTTGLTSGHYDSKAKASNYYAFPAYYYQHTIWVTLGNYKPDSIIYENHDSIWVYRYKNMVNDSVAYAIWSGTQTNRSTSNYAIKTGHAKSIARLISLKDKYMYGDTTNLISNNDGAIPITIAESPIILFTTKGLKGGELIRKAQRRPDHIKGKQHPNNNPETISILFSDRGRHP